MERICVFCGSSPGSDDAYVRAARSLGTRLAGEGISLVYGGARVGVMGQLAAACLQAGGDVVGVIPTSLVEMEVANGDLPRLEIVGSMHERKARMAELSDAFIALPGGLGTIEEFLEALTWAQLGFHDKPCGLLNTSGYFDGLLGFLRHAVEQRFVEAAHADAIQVDETIDGLLAKLDAYEPPRASKAEWVLRMSEGLGDS